MKMSQIKPALALSLSSLLATTAAINAGVYTNSFDAGAAGLTIYTIGGNAPEVRSTGGNPGGYLKLTDAENSTTSTVLFPDLDGGLAVQAFNFKVDCRIGNGSEVPADGFSISFARPGDATLDDGVGFNAEAAEEGTPTGLSVCFDTYDNTSPTVVDYIGFQVKLDGVPIAGGDVPAATLNGAIDDATSLETGAIGSAGWAPFEVTLKADGKLDVFWKNVQIITDLETGWTPSAGRIVFGARTGGLNAQHHFDNLSLTTTPAP